MEIAWQWREIEKALEPAPAIRAASELYGIPRVIPFAEDISGCYLAISSDTGRREVLDCFDDGPPRHGFHDVEALMAETVVGLQGWHPEERADFPDGGLRWVSRLWDEDDD